MIKINTLNGQTFTRMIISGANNLYNNRQAVNDLNVFPVPDGDTGTNMSLTVSAVSAEFEKNPVLSLTKAADTMSFAALRGARGNSGVILSQIFRGISKSLKGKNECNGAEIAAALRSGSDAAYKAVMKPTEGTILTVSREAANGAVLTSNTDDDIIKIFEQAVERGNKVLSKTTAMLPALRQAGVVDAGGQGWMLVLEGILSYLRSGVITEKEASVGEETSQSAPNISQTSVKTEDIKFRYCTEFIIEKKDNNVSADNFKNIISSKGDCMLVIDGGDIVKVHIHTNHPGFVLEEAVKLGELINLKIDNMKHQHKAILEESKGLAGNDSTVKAADSPKEIASSTKPSSVSDKKKEKANASEETKDFGFVAVCMGNGLSRILKDLGADKIIEGGQTMNPSTDDILKAIKRVKAKTVYVFPNNKNIFMAARQAAELTANKNVIVIEASSIPQCISALMSFNAKKAVEVNTNSMEKAIRKVKTGQLTYAVRDTEIDGISIKKDDILGLVENKITAAGKDSDDILDKVIADMVDDDTEFITVYYGKDTKKSQADKIKKALEKKYEDDEIEISLKKGGQPLYYYIVGVE